MISNECRAQRISYSQGEGLCDRAVGTRDEVQGFGAHKQPSPLDSRHISSGAAGVESRLQPCRVQGISMQRLKLELN